MPEAAAWALGGGVLGLIAGSFIATLFIRWPQDRSLGGRSKCDHCQRSLTFIDLVPLLSFAAFRGKCRGCSARINWRHPAIELAALVVGISALVVSPNLAGAAGALFGWQLLTLAALDAEHYWLPDRLTGLLAATGLAVGIAGLGAEIEARLIGGAIGFTSLYMIAWAYQRLRGRDGMGGGDPKLLGAIGCWLGWEALPIVLLAASTLGLMTALLLLLRGTQVNSATRLPLGTLMAVAAFLVWLVQAQG